VTERVIDQLEAVEIQHRDGELMALTVRLRDRLTNAVIEQQPDPNIAAQMKAYDFRKVIDNSVVERLVKEHFFEQLFGAGIKAEEDSKAKLAFK